MNDMMIGGCVLLGFLNGLSLGLALARKPSVTINNSVSLDPYDDDTDPLDDDDDGYDKRYRESLN